MICFHVFDNCISVSSSTSGKMSGSTPGYAAPTQSSSSKKSNVSGWGINSSPASPDEPPSASSSTDGRSQNIPSSSSSSTLYQPSHVKLPPHLNGNNLDIAITFLHMILKHTKQIFYWRILLWFAGEPASSPIGRRRRPEGGREELKPNVSSNSTGASSTTSPSTSRPGQPSQQQGGVGANRRRGPINKPTARQQRPGISNVVAFRINPL